MGENTWHPILIQTLGLLELAKGARIIEVGLCTLPFLAISSHGCAP